MWFIGNIYSFRIFCIHRCVILMLNLHFVGTKPLDCFFFFFSLSRRRNLISTVPQQQESHYRTQRCVKRLPPPWLGPQLQVYATKISLGGTIWIKDLLKTKKRLLGCYTWHIAAGINRASTVRVTSRVTATRIELRRRNKQQQKKNVQLLLTFYIPT